MCLLKMLANIVKLMKLQWDNFRNDLPDDLLLEKNWPIILKIFPWKDQITLFISLCLLNKVWKQLVNRNESWSTYNVHFVEYQHT
jgi:hypothetical protein